MFQRSSLTNGCIQGKGANFGENGYPTGLQMIAKHLSTQYGTEDYENEPQSTVSCVCDDQDNCNDILHGVYSSTNDPQSFTAETSSEGTLHPINTPVKMVMLFVVVALT